MVGTGSDSGRVGWVGYTTARADNWPCRPRGTQFGARTDADDVIDPARTHELIFFAVSGCSLVAARGGAARSRDKPICCGDETAATLWGLRRFFWDVTLRSLCPGRWQINRSINQSINQFLARDVIYTSRAYAMMSVSVGLSVCL